MGGGTGGIFQGKRARGGGSGGKERRDQGMVEDMEETDRERQKRERWERIGKSKYNRWYKEVKGEGIPGYLRKG